MTLLFAPRPVPSRPRVVARTPAAERVESIPPSLVAGACVLSVLATAVVYLTHHVGIFGDEASHLLAARRVFDSLTPGLAQLGQYYPPLFRALEVPFAAIGPLSRSGLSGSIPAMAGYVIGVAGAFRLGVELTRHRDGRGSRRAAWVGALAYATNPALLYLQAVPMLESWIAASLVWTGASAAAFLRTGRLRDAAVTSVWMTAAMYSHYGCWLLPVWGAAVVVISCYRHRYSWHRTEHHLLALLGLPVSAALAWMGWEFFLQGSPVWFATHGVGNLATLSGPAALRTAADTAFDAGHPGNALFAVLDYGLAIVHVLGPVLAGLVVVGLVVGLARMQADHPLTPTLMSGFFVIAVLTLLGGTVGSPTFAHLSGTTGPGATFDRAYNDNLRYGIYLLPFAAGCVAVAAADVRRWTRPAIAVAVGAGLLWFAFTPWPFAQRDDQRADNGGQTVLAAELRDRVAPSDVVLANSSAAGDRIIWLSRLDARHFLTDVNGGLFTREVRRPMTRWVLLDYHGKVGGRLGADELSASGYAPVAIYDVNGNPDFRYSLWERR